MTRLPCTLVGLLAMFLAACAQTASGPRPEARIAGAYTSRDLFVTCRLHLNADGSFSFYQLAQTQPQRTPSAVSLEESWGVSGSWTFQPPDRIELVSRSRAARTTIRVHFPSQDRVELEGLDALAGIIRDWDAAPPIATR